MTEHEEHEEIDFRAQMKQKRHSRTVHREERKEQLRNNINLADLTLLVDWLITEQMRARFVFMMARGRTHCEPVIRVEDAKRMLDAAVDIDELITEYMKRRSILEADAFEKEYAAASGTTVEELHAQGRYVEKCNCGDPMCRGWVMGFPWEEATEENIIRDWRAE